VAVGQQSAGILLFREDRGVLEVLIGHPGGPFWANKQEGAWSIPKGLVEPDEDPMATARREFAEETGFAVPDSPAYDLGSVELRSKKQVVAWAIRGIVDPADATSNSVRMEWPRGSGRIIEFPEIDELRWCAEAEAEILLNSAQKRFIARLRKRLDHLK
jgi:predicted NUDIX family NTP pyrophosphohydrolase